MPPYRSHVALIYNVTGQTLEWYPPDDEVLVLGAPASAASYSVWRGDQSNDETALFSGTATLDATNTGLNSNAGPAQANRTLVPIASTSNVVVGRRYAMKDANSAAAAVVTVKTFDDPGPGVFVTHDLAQTFTTNTTFKGLRNVFTVDATFIQTLSNINIFGTLISPYSSWNGGETRTIAPPYRVRWSYSLGGITRHQWTTFDVCRAPLTHRVTIEHLKPRLPDAVYNEWLSQRGADYQPQIEEGFTRVKTDIRLAGYDPDMIVDPELVDRLVTYAAIAVITRGRPGGDQDEQDYINLFSKSIGVVLKAHVSTDSTGAINPAPIPQLWLTR